MVKYTKFGLAVKKKLLGPPTRTQTWLAGEVRATTGLYVDSAYISKILTGRIKAPRITQEICEILELQYPASPQQSQAPQPKI